MVNSNNNYPHLYAKQVKETVFLKHFIHNPNIMVGDYTYYHDNQHPEYFERNNIRGCHECKLIIGKFCSIAMRTTFIMDDVNHPMDGFSTYPFFIFENWDNYTPTLGKSRNTVVGNDVWFGTNAVIMPGVTIGDGAIIGAYAVVTKDVPPYSIAVGNPSRIIRKRFSETIIGELVQIKWWDWDYDKITRNIEVIVGADINQLKECK
ncbi:CatB-related O-acetyltransferase [Candidatus Tisiphia endosymbiont of Nedyus quadrimaculatus]|uniref:CatB-related O-acetyltransferase n=1 Tax=Candidatus Tisiphia endosymbiont of Nedyus quadrimaculatus TaxID=3139332 RepID=UPI00345EF77D